MIARGIWQLEQFGRFVGFVARTLAVLPRAVVERFGEVVWQFEQVAVKSLPIVLGAGISVGLVTWLQTHRLLVANGAESALPSFLAVAVVVEIGPVLAGVLVASRMGAGLAAELGSMRLNEEIEARIVLGADPVPSLVAPERSPVPWPSHYLRFSSMHRPCSGRSWARSPRASSRRCSSARFPGLPAALRRDSGNAQDRRLWTARGPDRVLDGAECRSLDRGRGPGGNPRRRSRHSRRLRRQRRPCPVHPACHRGLGVGLAVWNVRGEFFFS